MDAGEKRKMPNVNICIDYVRGCCTKGTRCPRPHIDYVESAMDRETVAKLKFCHDYQNQGACGRSKDCRFLHVTREEEQEFLSTGTIPQSVFTRMREWNAERTMYSSFGDGPPSGGTRGGYGGGGSGIGRKRLHSDFSSPRGGVGGGARRRLSSGGGLSSNQPVTYENYCIDHLKGSCVKGDQCYLQHVETVDNPEDRDGIVKSAFCHDFQNNMCKRPFCKFVHSMREEEEFFLENGYFPPSLNARNHGKIFYSDICLDFLRNQCIRGAKCNFRHVQKVEARSERVCISRSVFCHDFQLGGCSRPNCKMFHTSARDEKYFIDTGMLSPHLKNSGSGGMDGGDVSKMASRVCREYVKNQCTMGDRCRFYHPPRHELDRILSHQVSANPGASSGNTHAIVISLQKKNDELATENEALKTRNGQLERLLADACYCMSLSAGDQNPAMTQLIKSMADTAQPGALGRSTRYNGGSSGGPLSIALNS